MVFLHILSNVFPSPRVPENNAFLKGAPKSFGDARKPDGKLSSSCAGVEGGLQRSGRLSSLGSPSVGFMSVRFGRTTWEAVSYRRGDEFVNGSVYSSPEVVLAGCISSSSPLISIRL